MPYIVKEGTIEIRNYDVEGFGMPAGHVLTPVPLPPPPHVWETNNIRTMNASELLEDSRDVKIKELKEEGLSRANTVYGNTPFPSIESLQVVVDQHNSYTLDGSLAPRLSSVGAVLTKFRAAKTVINGLDQAGINGYDVDNDPDWTA